MEIVKDEPSVVESAPAQKPKYDATKAYKWEADDKFYVSGQEFAILVQAIGNVVKSDISMPIQGAILLDRANQVLNGILAKYVELGVAREYTQPPPPQQERP